MKLYRSSLIALAPLSQLFTVISYIKNKTHIRNVKHIPRYGIKAPELLKKQNVSNEVNLLNFFKNKVKPLIKKTKQFNPKAAEGLEKTIKRGKLKQFKVFLFNVLNGKYLPVVCN